VLGLLERLNGEDGTTIVMVTHDARAAARARTRLFLEKGELARREENAA
jgi:putative ABC transport system ATP-binding protein